MTDFVVPPNKSTKKRVHPSPAQASPSIVPQATTDSSIKRIQKRETPDYEATFRYGALGGDGGVKWSKPEDEKLRKGVREFGDDWDKISWAVGTKSPVQCQQRWKKVLKSPGLVKGPWTQEEDNVVIEMVERYGVGKVKWSDIAARLPGRIGKQCRERWFNHLDPSINKSAWTPEEDQRLFELQQKIGNKWCEISKYLPGRSENAVKNRWNSSARKKWYKSLGLEDPLANKGKSSRRHRRRQSGASASSDSKTSGSPRPDSKGEARDSPMHGQPSRAGAAVSVSSAVAQLANSSVFSAANLPRLGAEVTARFTSVIQAAVETNTTLAQGQGSQAVPKLRTAIGDLVSAIQRIPIGRSFDFSKIEAALKDSPQLQAPVLLVHTLILADARAQAKASRSANPSLSHAEEVASAVKTAKVQGVPLISDSAFVKTESVAKPNASSSGHAPSARASTSGPVVPSISSAPEKEYINPEPFYSAGFGSSKADGGAFPPSPGTGRGRSGGSGTDFNPPSILTSDTHMEDIDMTGPDSAGLGSLGMGGTTISPFDGMPPLPLISPSSPARAGGSAADDYMSFMAVPSPGKKGSYNEPFGSRASDQRGQPSSIDPFFDVTMTTSPVNSRRYMQGDYLEEPLGNGDLDMGFDDSRDTWSESHTYTPTNTSATGFSTTDGGEPYAASDSPELKKALKSSRNALGTLSLEEREKSPIYLSRQAASSEAATGPLHSAAVSTATTSGGSMAHGSSFSSAASKRPAPAPLAVGSHAMPSPSSEDFVNSFITSSPSGRVKQSNGGGGGGR